MPNFKRESEIGWIVNGEEIEMVPLNRAGRQVCQNTEFLKDHLDAGCQEKDFEHWARVEETVMNGQYDLETGLTAVKVSGGGYRVGEVIKVADKEVMIDTIDAPDIENPYYVLWVKGYGAATNAGVIVQSGGKVKSRMVYIPRFVFPVVAHYPTVVLNLGGFWIDKYENSTPNANDKSVGTFDNRTVPVSKAGVVPWTGISFDEAKAAMKRRIIEDKECRLMDMWAFTSIYLYALLIGSKMKGNTDYGKWSGDPDELQYYGRRDITLPLDGYKMRRCLTGTGPVSWAHNELENGVYDLFGNVREFVDFTINAGVFTYRRSGRNAVARSGGETELFVEFHRNYESWPSSGILKVWVGADTNGHWEDVPYNAVSKVGPEVLKFTLASPLPGSVRVNDGVYEDRLYNVAPNTSRGRVLSEPVPVNGNYIIRTNKSDVVTNRPGDPFSIGDIIQLGIEQMQVIDVIDGGTYWTLVVLRAYNGKTTTIHVGDYFAVLSSVLQNGGPAGNEYQFCETSYFSSFEAAIYCLLPRAVLSTPVTPDFYVRYIGERVGIRGGYYGDGFAKPYFLDLLNSRTYTSTDVGFRGILELDRIEV